MEFRRRAIVNGERTWHVRELSAGAVEALESYEGGEFAQSMALLALSLCDEKGRPLYQPETLDEGLAEVRNQPIRLVRDVLMPAALELNEGGMDDARKN